MRLPREQNTPAWASVWAHAGVSRARRVLTRMGVFGAVKTVSSVQLVCCCVFAYWHVILVLVNDDKAGGRDGHQRGAPPNARKENSHANL